jgi:peroxiredoxin
VIAVASRGRSDVEKTRATLSTSHVPVSLVFAPQSYVLVPGPIPSLMKQYGVYNDRTGVAVPATLVIDRAGVIRWRHVGTSDSDRPGAAAIVGELRKLQ